MDEQIIATNPAGTANLEKQSKGLMLHEQRESDKVVDPFIAGEIDAILKAAAEHQPESQNYLQVAFFTGIRPSELKGLRWFDEDGRENIDFEHDILHVRATSVSLGSKVIDQDPKSY